MLKDSSLGGWRRQVR